MRVYIGPPTFWIGPYQIADVLLFFLDQDTRYEVTDWVIKRAPIINKVCEFIDSKRKQAVRIKLHNYDSWNADITLAHIILPLLKQVRENKQGAPFVDDEDVPDHLKSTSAPPTEDQYDTDENHFKRWDYVLNYMIWSFEQINIDWESQYHMSPGEWHLEKSTTCDGSIVVWDTEPEIDFDGLKRHQNKINKGLILFGKYYQSLWT